MSVFLKKLSSGVVVVVEHKKIKNVRLRVLPDSMVKLSVPVGVSTSWIDDYLQKNLSWIEKNLAYYKNGEGHNAETIVQNGESAYILGRQLTIRVNPAKVYHIEQSEDTLNIQSPIYDNPQALQRQYDRWLNRQSKKYFLEVIDKWYPVIAVHGFDKPKLQVRKMKTRWGSCSPSRKKINLNSNLYKASPACIDYIVLHEMAHFLYYHHNKDFYQFLSIHMADWKERKRVLNHGIDRG